METLFTFIVWFLIISTKMPTAQAAVYSSTDTALKFSQCLLEKMCESRFFSFHERDTMIGVADVMAQAMQNLEYGQRGPFSVKILLIAFINSIADVIVLEDLSRNIFRIRVYSTALEQCSRSTTGYVDLEFIKESLRIIYTLEQTKVANFHKEGAFGDAKFYAPETNPQASDVFEPFAVVPSPVQSPFIPVDYDSNTKTVFEMPESPLDFSPFPPASQSSTISRFPAGSESDIPLPLFAASSSSSQFGSGHAFAQPKSEIKEMGSDYSFDRSFVAPSFKFGDLKVPHTGGSSIVVNPHAVSQTHVRGSIQSQLVPQAEKNIQYPAQSGRKDLPSYPDISNVKSDSEDALPFLEIAEESSDATSLKETFQKPSSDFGGLKVPQTKESSIRVIPPIIQPQTVENAPPQDQLASENVKTLHPPSSAEIDSSRHVSSINMTSSASLPQTDEDGSTVQLDSTLESIILNLLTNSSTFKDAFSFGISPGKAVNLARTITEQSLTGYNPDIIKEALNAVSEAVTTVRISSPENYAHALSNALVSILKLHNLPLFVDGSKIAASMLSNIDTAMPSQTEKMSGQPKEEFPSVDNVQLEKQSPFDFQLPPVAPEDISGETFSEMLTSYLLKSDDMSNFFCSGDILPNKIQMYFSIIKPSLLEYGEQISSIAASVTSGILSELSGEFLCSNYAQTISEAIAEILDENELLVGANAEGIFNKMVLSLSEQLTTTTQFEKPEITTDGMPATETTYLPTDTTPTLQSSFASNFGNSDQDASTLFDVYYETSTYSIPEFEDSSYTTSDEPPEIKYDVERVTYLFTASPSPILISPAEELAGGYEAKNDYTSSFPSDFADKEHTSASTATESFSNLSAASDRENAKNYTLDDIILGASDDVIDQDALASFLFAEMESVFDAYTDKYSDQEPLTNVPSDAIAQSETGVNPVINNPPAKTEEAQRKESGWPQQNEKNIKNGTAASQPDIIVSPTRQVEESFENDNITLPSHLVKSRSVRRQSQSREIGDAVSVSKTYSKDSIAQIPSVGLQPSFQSPQSSDSSSALSKELPQIPSTIDNDASFTFAKAVSKIVADSIAYIRSGDFNVWELCGRLNELAPILNIPLLDYCAEIPIIDYLLHTLQSVAEIMKDV